MAHYIQLVCALHTQLESFSDTHFDCPTFPEVKRALEESDLPGKLPGYQFLAYLRHHGCPSPLLDWTRSPYVAAFFAFASPAAGADSTAIFVYQEHVGQGKMSGTNEPRIDHFGPYFRSHRRHALQQSEYTICVKGVGSDQVFSRHEEAIASGGDGQDRIIKIVISGAERAAALRELDQFNLNAYSLFGTDDSLIQTIWAREALFRRKGNY